MPNYPYRNLGIPLNLENWEALNRNFDDIETDIKNISGNVLAEVVDEAKLIWKPTVDTFAELSTTYPTPEVGWTVFARNDGISGEVYRYDGFEWVKIQEFDATAIDALDIRVSDEFASRKNLDLIGAVKYGKIDINEITTSFGFPNFVHNLTFDLYRDVDGKVKHTFDFDKRIEGWNVFYVDGINGNQSNNGLTPSTPKLSLDLTITEIEANAGITSAEIRLLGNYIPRTRSAIGPSLSITKNYAITSENPRFFAGSIEPQLAWTSVGSGVYSATRSGVTAVFDDTVRGLYDLPTEYVKAASLTECTNTRGSWYQSGSLVYVHRLNNAAPTNGETYVCVDAFTLQPVFKTDSLFMAKNMTLLSGSTAAPAFFKPDTGIKGNIILQNVTVKKSAGLTNGFGTDSLKSAWLFDCKALDVQRDAFNYHCYNGDGTQTFVFEYNCFGENAGVTDVTDINNITTAHEGMRILRVASKGSKSKGPVLADVHGCYSICIDCVMNDSLIANDEAYNKAAFFFEDSTGTDGHAILINCSGGDAETKGISCGTSFKAQGKIGVNNFVGRNIPGDVNFTIA